MQTRKITFIFTMILIFFLSYAPLQAQLPPLPFMIFTDEFELPAGIAVDAAGNVYIHFEDLRSTELVQLDEDAYVLDQISIGAGVFEKSLFVGSRLSYDPVLGVILLLTPMGDVLRIDSGGLQGSEDQAPVISILPDAVSPHHAYDINTDQAVSFGLAPADTVRYGDLALFRSHVAPGQLELLITGAAQRASDASARPFIIHLSVDAQWVIISAQIVLTSTAVSATAEHQTRGIAVNHQGIGVTTLPVSHPSNPGETVEVAVMFPVGMAPITQPEVLFGFLDVASRGMTTDEAGNFYIASGEEGSSACAPNQSGALIVVPVNANGLPFGLAPLADAVPAGPTPLGTLHQLTCFPIATTSDAMVSSRDVAVSAVNQSVYITLNNSDEVLKASQP